MSAAPSDRPVGGPLPWPPDGVPAWVEAIRRADRPHVIHMCGLPGSGKTRLALRLEKTLPAVRFNADEWIIPLFGEHMPRAVFDRRFAAVEALAWRTAERLLELGIHVVLDYGCWTRASRAAAVRQAVTVGAVPLLVFLDIPRVELERRLARRNEAGGVGSFEITPEMLDLFAARFEPPSADERLSLVRVGPTGDEALPGGA